MAPPTPRQSVGYIALLTALLVILKLSGQIAGSWTWVLAPVWMSFTLIFGIILGVVIFVICTEWNDDR